jgi:hypothetical protein
MGQKASPLVLRDRSYPLLWSQNFLIAQNLRRMIIEFFLQKGLYISKLSVYLVEKELFLSLSFLTSRKSMVFHSKCRRFFKKKRSKESILVRKSSESLLGISAFLRSLSSTYGVRQVFLKVKRLDARIHPRIVSNIWISLKRYTSYSYRRNPYVLDLILVASSILVKEGTAFLLNQVLVSMFNRLPKRHHRRFLLFLKQFCLSLCALDSRLNNCIQGIRFLVSGKISGKTRSKHFSFSAGRVSMQSLEVPVDYSSLTSFTVLGTFGFKVWIASRQ